MTIWAIGDVQGCCQELTQLLAHPLIHEDTHATLWFAGDLVNRGPCSLQTLRLLMSLGSRAQCVLGNHDIHLLAVAAGVRSRHRLDTLNDILTAPDSTQILDWLRTRPLALSHENYLMVHAGVRPEWTIDDTIRHAQSVEAVLQAPDWKRRIAALFGNAPNHPDLISNDEEARRLVVNTLTRIRYCTKQGQLDFDAKEGINQHTDIEHLIPWFDLANRQTAQQCIVFGHWSTLGLINTPTLLSLDTGCVWGGQLTAVRLHDRKVIQITCPQQQDPHN